MHENTLNFKSHIRDNQWYGLLKKSYISGVNAGVICWFIDNDITLYLPIGLLEELKLEGFKSFNAKDYLNDNLPTLIYEPIEIIGTKRKIFFDYSLKEFLKELNYE